MEKKKKKKKKAVGMDGAIGRHVEQCSHIFFGNFRHWRIRPFSPAHLTFLFNHNSYSNLFIYYYFKPLNINVYKFRKQRTELYTVIEWWIRKPRQLSNPCLVETSLGRGHLLCFGLLVAACFFFSFSTIKIINAN